MGFKINYSGGGLLIASADPAGVLHVLLGKRLNNPGAGKWSFPGGESLRYRGRRRQLGLAIYDESCRSAAPREIVRLWGLRTFFLNWATSCQSAKEASQ